MKFGAILLGMFVLSIMSVIATPVSNPTIITGIVYGPDGITPVPDVTVTATCDDLGELSDVSSDPAGEYVIEFIEGCDIGDAVHVCAGDGNCYDGIVTDTIFWKNLVQHNFNVPEFSIIAASIAAGGAGLGFLLLRKRK